MKFKQKSQITMIIIIGLVMFIVISFVLYISKSAIKKQSQQNIKKIQGTAIDEQPIEEFVAKCLDKLAKDSIVLLGKQGGYIYKSQGGTLADYDDTDQGIFFVNKNDVKVTYNILPPKFSLAQYFSQIPTYPWSIFPYDATLNSKITEGYFGISNLPPLESTEGPNSIQSQIEAYIDSNMLNCLDFSLFKERGFGITINSTKTSAILGSNDVSIKSKIPLIITDYTTKKITRLDDFSSKVDVRLRSIYFFTRELIVNDVKNIAFNISDPKNEYDFRVQVARDAPTNDDLITIVDEKSLIYGRPFEYIFARKNRAPALYYIKNNVLEFEQIGAEPIKISKNDLLKGADLKADDPDEDVFDFKIYEGEEGQQPVTFPFTLSKVQTKFRIEVSDGELSDYQIITVNRLTP